MPRKALRISCPLCGSEIQLSERMLRKDSNFEVACSKCKRIFNASELARKNNENSASLNRRGKPPR